VIDPAAVEVAAVNARTAPQNGDSIRVAPWYGCACPSRPPKRHMSEPVVTTNPVAPWLVPAFTECVFEPIVIVPACVAVGGVHASTLPQASRGACISAAAVVGVGSGVGDAAGVRVPQALRRTVTQPAMWRIALLDFTADRASVVLLECRRSAMIRTGPRPRIVRRQLLRYGFLGGLSLAGAEIAGSLLPFLQVRRIVGLGVPVNVGPRSQILTTFAETNDAPILFRQGHFFLLHAPGGIIAAYRKCTHLGCAVPFSAPEDRFHCPCHGSIYDKRTAIVIRDPAPKPLPVSYTHLTLPTICSV